MWGNLTGWHALVVIAVVLLLFGATKLPALARSIGQSTRILRAEIRSKDGDDGETPTVPSHVEGRDRAARDAPTA